MSETKQYEIAEGKRIPVQYEWEGEDDSETLRKWGFTEDYSHVWGDSYHWNISLHFRIESLPTSLPKEYAACAFFGDGLGYCIVCFFLTDIDALDFIAHYAPLISLALESDNLEDAREKEKRARK